MEFLSRYIDIFIFSTLGIMSIISVGVAIERVIFFLGCKIVDYDDINALERDTTKNLTTLSVIGTNAPYVGLLGTVVGIIVTFYDMGRTGNFETTTIMSGLSIALKATALGLCVAIPSLVFYSFSLRAADKKISEFKSNQEKKR
ncbi:MAG: TonB-system energizer ExbB [Campylobacter sp.]|nr:TonB-system energizer ExbB [Campylobacter sp.]